MDNNVIETTTTDNGEIKRKTHFTGTVVKTSLAGAIVDIGLTIPGVVHISQLQKDPVNRVEDVVQIGQSVEVWVRRTSPKGSHVELTMIKPLDLEWRDIKPEMVLKGKVVRMEKFGAFVDIGAERAGLVHVSELTHGFIRTPDEVVKEGDEVEVKILDVDRKKKQIKLSMKALEEPPVKIAPPVNMGGGGGKPGGKDMKGKDKDDEIDAQDEEINLTAMESAMREAMERSKSHKSEKKGKRRSGRPELEDILARTLKTRKS